jgi:hypothetical protein
VGLGFAACAPADLAAPRAAGAIATRTLATATGADGASDTGDAPAERLPADVVRRQLERAADGLLYTSETDHPFAYVHRAGPAPTPLTVAAFRAAFAVPDDVAVEELSLDDFLARHIERVDPNDPVAVALVPRYRQLRETLRRSVRAARVFRVGRIANDCYLVGTDASDDVVGLATLAVET